MSSFGMLNRLSLLVWLKLSEVSIKRGICERIYVLDHGVLLAEGTPEEIRNNPKVIEAYLGEEVDE